MSDSTNSADAGLSRVEQVYRKLKTSILTNEFSPGYQALEPEIAKQLGVSRTPVREALIRLEAERLIELIPRRGMRVLSLVPEDVSEINQVITGLEVSAIELVGRKGFSQDVLSPLDTAIQKMVAALNEDNLEAWSDAEEEYREYLVNLSGNKRLQEFVNTVRAQIYRVRKITLMLRPKPDSTNVVYRDLYTALLEGDWAKAKDIYYQHRVEYCEMLMELLDRYQLSHL